MVAQQSNAPVSPTPTTQASRVPSIQRIANADRPPFTTFSIGSLTSRPDDVALHIDWERRTTSVTLTYNSAPHRPPLAPFAPVRNASISIPRNLEPAIAPAASLPSGRQLGAPCPRACANRSTIPPIPRLNRGLPQAQAQVQADARRHDGAQPPVHPALPREDGQGARAAAPGDVPRIGTVGPEGETAAPPAAQAPAAAPTNTPVIPRMNIRSTLATPPATAPATDPAPDVEMEEGSSPESPIVVKQEPGLASGLPAEEPRKRILHPRKKQHKIRETERYTTWYSTKSRNALPRPPHILKPARGNLYVHRHRAGVQVWLYYACAVPRRPAGAEAREGAWQVVHEGVAHPELDGYVLHLLDDGTPRWVKEASAQTYAAARRKRERMARLV
ncbi:hypothetical protein BD413DRAFT_622494 [Trametes elegans]|nr:hypothetical protein BD413DRAFT_622494 [Trametes elegans]